MESQEADGGLTTPKGKKEASEEADGGNTIPRGKKEASEKADGGNGDKEVWKEADGGITTPIDINEFKLWSFRTTVTAIIYTAACFKVLSIASEVVTYVTEPLDDDTFGDLKLIAIMVAMVSGVLVGLMAFMLYTLTKGIHLGLQQGYLHRIHDVFRGSGGPFVVLIVDAVLSVALVVVNVLVLNHCREAERESSDSSADACSPATQTMVTAIMGLLADVFIVIQFQGVQRIKEKGVFFVVVKVSAQDAPEHPLTEVDEPNMSTWLQCHSWKIEDQDSK